MKTWQDAYPGQSYLRYTEVMRLIRRTMDSDLAPNEKRLVIEEQLVMMFMSMGFGDFATDLQSVQAEWNQ